MKKKDPNLTTQALTQKQSKNTNNQAFISDKEEKHCLWINQDTGEVNVIPLSTPIEKVPLGFYVPCHIGTRKQMEKAKRQIILSRIKPKRFRA